MTPDRNATSAYQSNSGLRAEETLTGAAERALPRTVGLPRLAESGNPIRKEISRFATYKRELPVEAMIVTDAEVILSHQTYG